MSRTLKVNDFGKCSTISGSLILNEFQQQNRFSQIHNGKLNKFHQANNGAANVLIKFFTSLFIIRTSEQPIPRTSLDRGPYTHLKNVFPKILL